MDGHPCLNGIVHQFQIPGEILLGTERLELRFQIRVQASFDPVNATRSDRLNELGRPDREVFTDCRDKMITECPKWPQGIWRVLAH